MEDQDELRREIERLREALAKSTADAAVMAAKLDLMTRQVEDLRMLNYRLDAQNIEGRIARAVAEERAAAARELAASRMSGGAGGAIVTTIVGGGTPCGCGCGDKGKGPRPSAPTGGQTGGSQTGGGGQTGGGTTPATKTLVIDRMLVEQTPQSGTWLFCFQANAASGANNLFHIPNETYSGDGITIDLNLSLSPVTPGELISFKAQLDDDEADVCGNDAEDKSTGSFNATATGNQVFSFDNWVYTLTWHLE